VPDRYCQLVALAQVPAAVVRDFHAPVCLLVVVRHIPLLPVRALQLAVRGVAGSGLISFPSAVFKQQELEDHLVGVWTEREKKQRKENTIYIYIYTHKQASMLFMQLANLFYKNTRVHIS
jgi:hypothetical protein